MPAQDLYVSILPDGFLSLEWMDTEEELSPTRIALREELYRRYQPDYHQLDRKSKRLTSSHGKLTRMPSSA